MSQKAIEIKIVFVAKDAMFALFNTIMSNMLNGMPTEQITNDSQPCIPL
jgi:hypothetical protein